MGQEIDRLPVRLIPVQLFLLIAFTHSEHRTYFLEEANKLLKMSKLAWYWYYYVECHKYPAEVKQKYEKYEQQISNLEYNLTFWQNKKINPQVHLSMFRDRSNQI
ncbi:hypothetical protein [Bacillus thuringiensis]|uniref:hypothetical protein n=1 Tax=Bacillus cereus group TaxID=86661 RepID=UPI000BF74DB7|nr:hypothetical protein [Bacillus thuringiensis]MED3622019.1 hypothetical protein [Bacillus thuringiensis]PEW28485.1 hypothetical protein CN427_11685 [Bacillus thuringiensis]